MYIYTHIHVYIYNCLHVHTFSYICIYIYTCTRLYPPIYIGGKDDQQTRNQQKPKSTLKYPFLVTTCDRETCWSGLAPGKLQTDNSAICATGAICQLIKVVSFANLSICQLC